MCEMLGTDPDLEQVPLDRTDLGMETQLVFDIYDKLPSRWEGFSGQYLGKDLILLPVLMDEFDFDSYMKKYSWTIIPIIDSFVAQDIAQKIKNKSKSIK